MLKREWEDVNCASFVYQVYHEYQISCRVELFRYNYYTCHECIASQLYSSIIYTSSAPPKLAHISRAQKQRYLLEIAFANIISRGNRTRQGVHVSISSISDRCRPRPQNRLRFVLYQVRRQAQKLVCCV